MRSSSCMRDGGRRGLKNCVKGRLINDDPSLSVQCLASHLSFGAFFRLALPNYASSSDDDFSLPTLAVVQKWCITEQSAASDPSAVTNVPES